MGGKIKTSTAKKVFSKTITFIEHSVLTFLEAKELILKIKKM